MYNGRQKKQLRDIAIAIKDGTHGTFRRVGNGVPLLSAKNVTNSGKIEWDSNDDLITEEDYNSIISSFNPCLNDLLLTIVGTLGRKAIYRGERVAFQRSVAFIRPDHTQVLSEFLFHFFDCEYFQRQLIQRSNATAQTGLYLGELSKTEVSFPSIAEQGKIVGIINAIDSLIQQTENIITKLKQIRAGLLHDLLTYGIDDNGELRDPVAHPEQFKDSPLGRIPMVWELPQLSNLCKYIGSGVTPRGGQDVYKNDGILFIRSQNVTLEGLRLNNIAYIPESIHSEMLRSEVLPYDVLYNITGASIGRCCHMPAGLGKANVNQHVCILRIPYAEEFDAIFLSKVLLSKIGVKQLYKLNTNGNRQGINYQQLGRFVITWPNKDERKEIVQNILQYNLQIDHEIQFQNKIKQIKSGLTTDLLTGKVPVPETIMQGAI